MYFLKIVQTAVPKNKFIKYKRETSGGKLGPRSKKRVKVSCHGPQHRTDTNKIRSLADHINEVGEQRHRGRVTTEH